MSYEVVKDFTQFPQSFVGWMQLFARVTQAFIHGMTSHNTGGHGYFANTQKQRASLHKKTTKKEKKKKKKKKKVVRGRLEHLATAPGLGVYFTVITPTPWGLRDCYEVEQKRRCCYSGCH